MLSTKTLKGADSTKSYFLGQDDYYLRDAVDKSAWFGVGAKTLGLNGQVNVKEFESLLSGLLPNGEQLGKNNDGKINHRAGFDLTFSAPKSVSILAEIGQDKRIYAAHDKAVETALAYIEKSCAQARKTVLGKTNFENTQNIVAAIFKHDTSRKLDPQLHTHAVVMNATQRADGAWRSLASDKFGYGEGTNGFIERVRSNKIYFGSIYRAVLAYELKQMGYSITKTHTDGRFEITGVPQNVIEHFSQRREEIESFLKEKGWTGANAAAYVTLGTRERKKDIPPELLHAAWLERSLKMGFNPKQAVKELAQESTIVKKDNSQQTQTALNYAIDHLSERDVLLSHHKLLNVAASHIVGEVNVPNLIEAIDKSITDGLLLPIAGKGEQYYTTTTLINAEKDLVNLVINNQNKSLPIGDEQKVLSLAKDCNLNAEQFVAFKKLTASTDRFVAINGIAGSGKTHTLNTIAVLAHSEGRKVLALTPSQAQAKQWYKVSGIHTDTITGFLNKESNNKSVDMLLVDNAHLVSVRQLKSLFEKAENLNAKIILAGDTKAYLPIEAGSPFSQLIKSGLTTENLQKIQKNQDTKLQVQSVFVGNIDDAFAKTHIVELSDKEERLQKIATHYSSLNVKTRQNTLVLLPNKKECDTVNKIIHDKLQENGDLKKKDIILDVYLPKALTRAQRHSAKNYEVNNVIRFNEEVVNLKIKKGEYRTVLAIDEKNNKLIINDGKNREKSIYLDRNFALEVFNHEQRAISKGEKLQAFRSIHGITSGDVFTVKAIRSRSLVLAADNGNKIKLARKDIGNLHLDYAYSTTPYRAQHLNPNTVIAHNSSEHFATNQRLLYKEFAQAQKEIYLYTDNKEACLTKFKEQSGDKMTALDAVFNKTDITNPKEQIAFLEKKITKILTSLEEPIDIAKEAAIYAMTHLAEREAAFTHKELLTTAITHVLGEVPLEKLEQAILQTQDVGDLVRGQKNLEGTRWTTTNAINLEKSLLQTAQEEQGKVARITSTDTNTLLESSILRSDQRNAIAVLASTQDRITLVQGYAGAGKTTMLVSFQDIANKNGYEICGLAPSHTAAEELTTRGIKAQTLQSFLIEAQKVGGSVIEQNKKIYVLDEASMVSSRDMVDLLKFITTQNARLIAVGDKDQLASPEAGKPFILMQQAGIKTVLLTDIQRQDPSKQELRDAVKSAIQKDFTQSFVALDKQNNKPNIIELDNKETRLQSMADDYLSRDPTKRANTLLITPLNADRCFVNELIRSGLKSEGELAGNGVNFPVWVPRHLTQIEISRADNYQIGDVVRFNRNMYHLGVTKNSYLNVTHIDISNNALTLKSGDKTVIWHMQGYGSDKRGTAEIYRQENRELCVGDQIIWTRSDKTQNLINGSKGKVTAVDHSNITLQMDDGKIKELDVKIPTNLHFDHAYAVTAYAAQGKTIAEVIDHEDSTLKYLTNQRGFYVAITRAQQQVTIYTDNKKELIKRVQRNTGEKWSALEVTGKLAKTLPKSDLSIERTQPQIPVTPTQRKIWDTKQIQQGLVENAEYVVEKLLGEPHKQLNSEWRYGSNKGSLVVTMHGQDRGLWYDFQSGEGGDLLKLIMQKYGYNHKEFFKTLEVAAEILGLTEAKKITAKETVLVKDKINNSKQEFSDYQRKSIDKAQKLWNESKPIADTVAEKYLREHRGITKSLPEDLRFHPDIYSQRNNAALPALIVACRDKDGRIQAIQATYLDTRTNNKANVEVKKQVFGVLKGSAVTLQNGQNQSSILICEGVETGLSLCEADDKKTIKATLGIANFINIPTDAKAKNVTLCLDNDGDNTAVNRLIKNACNKLIKEGKEVFCNKPNIIHKDYNDILKEQDSNAVKKMIDASVNAKMTTPIVEKIDLRENKKLRSDAQKPLNNKMLRNTPEVKIQDQQRTNSTQKTQQHNKTPQTPQQPNIAKQIIKNIEKEL